MGAERKKKGREDGDKLSRRRDVVSKAIAQYGKTQELDLQGGGGDLNGLLPRVETGRLPARRLSEEELTNMLASNLGEGEYPKNLRLHYAFSHLTLQSLKVADILAFTSMRLGLGTEFFLSYATIAALLGRSSRQFKDLKNSLQRLRDDSYREDDGREDELSDFNNQSFLAGVRSGVSPQEGAGVYVVLNQAVARNFYVPYESPILALQVLAELENKYAYRLYPWLMGFLGDETYCETDVIPLDKLRRVLLMREKSAYWSRSWHHLNRDLFGPALDQINSRTSLNVEVVKHQDPNDKRRTIGLSFKLTIRAEQLVAEAEQYARRLHDRYEFTMSEALELVKQEGVETIIFADQSAANSISRKRQLNQPIGSLKNYFLGVLKNVRGRRPSVLLQDGAENDESRGEAVEVPPRHRVEPVGEEVLDRWKAYLEEQEAFDKGYTMKFLRPLRLRRGPEGLVLFAPNHIIMDTVSEDQQFDRIQQVFGERTLIVTGAPPSDD